MSANLFIGVQSDLRPIAKSLLDYLSEQPVFDQCIVRAPMGLKLSEARPLQFTDVLSDDTSHLVNGVENVTLFIGSPDLVSAQDWVTIAKVIGAWKDLGCKSLCFEAMLSWNEQFQFAYSCCKIAGIAVMIEGVPVAGQIPADVEILLQSQRFVNNYRLKRLPKEYRYNVIVRRDALKFPGVYKGLFGKVPTTLDELESRIEATGASVYRYDADESGSLRLFRF